MELTASHRHPEVVVMEMKFNTVYLTAVFLFEEYSSVKDWYVVVTWIEIIASIFSLL